MIRVAVLGYGYWGPNLARVFADTRGASLAAVADPSVERLAVAQARHPAVRVCAAPVEAITATDVDAVVLATPVATHAALAATAIRAGKHVLVEKPLAETSTAASSLVDEATRAGCVLMVDHTFVYSSAVREVRRLVAAGAIGDVVVYDTTRTSLARFQPDVGVLWDLAVHDLAILDAVVGASPVAVSAAGVALAPDGRPDVALLTLQFATPLVAHIHVNWVSALKLRRTSICGTLGTIVYDDAEASEKVKLCMRDAHPHAAEALDELRVAHRAGAITVPRLSSAEPLRTMARHFIECIETGARPHSDGASALRVLRVLEAAAVSMAAGGRLVPVESAASQPTSAPCPAP